GWSRLASEPPPGSSLNFPRLIPGFSQDSRSALRVSLGHGATTTLKTKETRIMKTLCSTLIAIGLFTGFASAALAQPKWWNQVITGHGRFTVLSRFDGDAVFDKESGLVWEQAPHTQEVAWDAARRYCAGLAVGNRRGWRLPAIQELESLIDGAQS